MANRLESATLSWCRTCSLPLSVRRLLAAQTIEMYPLVFDSPDLDVGRLVGPAGDQGQERRPPRPHQPFFVNHRTGPVSTPGPRGSCHRAWAKGARGLEPLTSCV